MTELSIHHLGYITREIAKSIRMYEALGYEKEGELILDSVQNNRIQLLTKPGETLRIELIEPLQDSTVKNFPDGFQHICYDASHISGFETWFQERKLGKIYRRAVTAPALGGAVVCFACMTDHSFAEFIVKP